MKKKTISAFLPLVLIYACIYAQTDFGYISYSSYNIGDDIQAVAAKRFLPENSIAIDREFIGAFEHAGAVKTLMNGWYMHTKDYCWYVNDVPPPDKCWPPPPSIDPLLISIHLDPGFVPEALSDEGIAYLKQHGPVGARDYPTLHLLQAQNIPSYFSGCLTLTLENDCQERGDIIYAVDIDSACLAYLKSKTQSKVEVVHHGLKFITFLTNQQRLNYAENLLEKYKRAKCVVTTRLHATLPNLALETPVLLINQKGSARFDGLKELVRNCTRDEFLRGEFEFDFDHPGPNPEAYIPIRNNLIDLVTQWVINSQTSVHLNGSIQEGL